MSSRSEMSRSSICMLLRLEVLDVSRCSKPGPELFFELLLLLLNFLPT